MVYLVPLGNKVEDEIYWEEDKLPKTRVTSGYTVTIVTGDKGKQPGDVLESHRTQKRYMTPPLRLWGEDE